MPCKHEDGGDPCVCTARGVCKVVTRNRNREQYAKPLHRAKDILDAHKKRGRELCVSPEWLAKYLAQPCPVFDCVYRDAGKGLGPDSPTIDHFNPKGGDGESNLWVISKLANSMKQNGRLDHAVRLVAWWAVVQRFQRTLSMEEFYRIRNTMRERLKETIAAVLEENKDAVI